MELGYLISIKWLLLFWKLIKKIVRYCDYKPYDIFYFQKELRKKLSTLFTTDKNKDHEIYQSVLNINAPLKQTCLRKSNSFYEQKI